MAAARRARGAPASLRTWLIRAAVVATVGVTIGAAGGVVGVRTLEPGRPEQADSLQLMLDSIANGTAQKSATMAADDARSARRAVDSADATNRAQNSADSTAMARTVPDVIGLEEGTARTRITEAGLTVGDVQFEDSPKAAGTVLRSAPAAGTTTVSGAAVTLFLSTGRPPADDTTGTAMSTASPLPSRP